MPEFVTREEFLDLSKKVDEAITSTNDKIGDSARRDTVNKIFERLDKHKERILTLDTEVKVMKTLMEPLRELPDALASLKESLVSFKGSLDEVNVKVDEVKKSVDESISKVEENVSSSMGKVHKRIDIVEDGLELQKHRGKIDVLDWLAKHWDKLALAAAIVYVCLQSTMK